MTPHTQASLNTVLARDIRGSRIGLFVPCAKLRGRGDLVAAQTLSRILHRLGAEVTVYTDATDTAQLSLVHRGQATASLARLHVASVRDPVPSLRVGGVVWMAAGPALTRAAFGPAELDLLVCVHDVPGFPNAVTCPALFVHEYGDHDPRWGHLCDRDRTLVYRTGFVVDNRHPGDIAGGIYLDRSSADRSSRAPAPSQSTARGELLACVNELLNASNQPSGPASDVAELTECIRRAECLSVYYVGQRKGAEQFVAAWCCARRAAAPLPVLVAVLKPRRTILDALDASEVPYLAFVVDARGRVSRHGGSRGDTPRVCAVILESPLPADAFQCLLASANDVSLLTGDHSITEALAVGSGSFATRPGILPLLYVGYYEKAEDYAQFLSEFDPVLAAVYLAWVVPRVDGTPMTPERARRVKQLGGAHHEPGLEYVFSARGATALRAAVAGFYPWLESARSRMVGGRDAAFVLESFPRAVAHMLGGHNIDDLRAH